MHYTIIFCEMCKNAAVEFDPRTKPYYPSIKKPKEREKGEPESAFSGFLSWPKVRVEKPR